MSNISEAGENPALCLSNRKIHENRLKICKSARTTEAQLKRQEPILRLREGIL